MEKLIDEKTAEQLKERFKAEMKDDVEVTLFTSDTVPAEKSPQEEVNMFAKQLVKELSEIDNRIKMKEEKITADKEMKIKTSPSFMIGRDKGYTIIYNGAPLGHEASGFIETIMLVSSGVSGLDEENIKLLDNIQKQVDVKVFVTPTCPYCPKSVLLANKTAIAAKGRITAECIEATQNKELSARFNLSSVPQQVIDENPETATIGAQPENKFILELVKHGAPDKYKKIEEEIKMKKNEDEKLPDSPGKPVYLTDGNFDEALKKYKNLIVDFRAEWCMPCKMLEPVINELASEYAGKVVFGKLDVDESGQKPGEYGIMSIPNLVIFKEGVKAGDVVGAVPKEQLKNSIKEHFNL